jgi:hypothetical protein
MYRIAALAALALAAPAQAATFTPISEAAFSSQCAACELAVPEVRYGDGGTNQTWEFSATAGSDNQQAAWTSGQSYAFQIAYDQSTTTLSLDIGGQVSTRSVDLSGANAIFLRARAEPAGSTRVSVSGNDLVENDPSDGLASYLRVTDFVGPTGNFTLDGTFAFDFDSAANPSNSRFAWQAKIGQISPADIAAVPLPAPALLLGAALGGLAMFRRRRT